MNKMKNFGIAVIGCGNAGYNHLKNFLAEPEISHVIAVDVSKDRLDEIRAKHNVRTSTDYKDVLKDPDVKAVVIASTNETHPIISIAAMESGKDVFCEKPIAPTLEECRQVVKVARQTGRIFHTHFELRHSFVPRRIKEILEKGEIGNIRSLNMIHYRGPFRPEWKGNRKLSGGLTLMETCHTIDLFRYLSNSEVRDVFSFGAIRAIPYYDYADTEYLTMKMDNGIVAHITSCHTRSADNKYGDFKPDEYLEKKYGHQYEYNILGTKGSIWYTPLRDARIYIYEFKQDQDNWKCILRREEDYGHIPFNVQIHGSDHKEFIKAVLEGRDTYITPEDALKTHEVCFAVERSRDEGGKGIYPDSHPLPLLY